MCKNTGSDDQSKMLVEILETCSGIINITICSPLSVVLRTGQCLISPIPDEEARAEPQLVHLMIRLGGFSQISGNEINLQCGHDPGLSCTSIGMINRYQ